MLHFMHMKIAAYRCAIVELYIFDPESDPEEVEQPSSMQLVVSGW